MTVLPSEYTRSGCPKYRTSLCVLIAFQGLVREVRVGIYLLNVVQVFELVQKPEYLARRFPSSATVLLGMRDTSDELIVASLDSSALRTSSSVLGSENTWSVSSSVSKSSAPASMATRAKSSACSSDASTVMMPRLSNCHETEPGLCQVSARPGQRRPNIGYRPVAVVGKRFQHNRHAARPVTLVNRFYHLNAVIALARARALSPCLYCHWAYWRLWRAGRPFSA